MSSSQGPGLRTDIQALRGLAVTLVVLYHAHLPGVASGFLGVDMFFVISGYLITAQIAAGLKRGNFSFGQFYYRRAKRLLPAAYVTLLATWAAASFLLGPAELADLKAQMWGAISFSANVVLWKQSGYFQGSAELKPLLHFWSLAVEEQYYLVVPLMLALTPKRLWVAAATGALLLSLGACLAFMGRDVAFYLLPFRAWEMLMGSLVALGMTGTHLKPGIQTWCVRLYRPALLVLVVLPLTPSVGPHPGGAAVLICVCTAVVLARAHPSLFGAKSVRPLVWLGDRSYSLYLVHWPLFAFLSNVWLPDSPAPLGYRLALILLSLALAWALHCGVEKPARELTWPRMRVLMPILGSSAGLAVLPLMSVGASAATEGSSRLANQGLSAQCDYQTLYRPQPSCQTGPQPEVMVWGDSFAMHLLPGLAADGRLAIAQATRAVCGPLLGLAVIRERERDRGMAWSRSCIEFNYSVLDYLRHSPQIRLVILSSPFDQFTNSHEEQVVWNGQSNHPVRQRASTEQALAALHRTVQSLREIGKTVVVVAPPPMGGFDIGRCLERKRLGLPVQGVAPDCSIPQAWYRHKRNSVLGFLDAVPTSAQVSLIRFDPLLCDADSCRTSLDGVALYRDGGHLSRDGSVVLSRKMDLLSIAQSKAR